MTGLNKDLEAAAEVLRMGEGLELPDLFWIEMRAVRV